MRADMAKVIVERSRKKGCAWNKPKGYQRRLRRFGEDGPPAQEGIKACWQGHTKFLNEQSGLCAATSTARSAGPGTRSSPRSAPTSTAALPSRTTSATT